jgi:hypothetical protein
MFANRYNFIRKYRDQAGDGGDPGAADPGAAPAAPAAPAAAPTALEQIAAPAPAAIPEKYQVKNEDGTINLEASSSKLAEAYAHAEKRIGSGDLPPKTAAEYQVAVPETLAGAWDPAADPLFGAFSEKAHGLGFTQAQMDLVVATYGEIAPGLVQGAAAMDADSCIADLKGVWKTDEEMKAGMDSAVRAAKAYAGTEAEAMIARYGNDPQLIRMLSNIGKEVGEDNSIEPGAILGSQTIEELERSNAYRDPKDPQHAAVSAKVKAYYDAKAAQDAKAGNVPLM